MERAHGLAALLLTLALWGGASTSVARASCVLEELVIVWSYPADGATNVPTDADFFVLLNDYAQNAHVELNGQQLISHNGRQFDLGELEPNTEYVVRTSSLASSGSSTLETRFTTGSSAAQGPSTPTLTAFRVEAFPQPLGAQQCPAVLQAQDCFDTGQDAVVQLLATGDATLWLVESSGPGADGGGQPIISAWPGECGPPSIVYHRQRIGLDPPCVRLTSVSASGEHRSSGELCFDEPDSGKGCAVGLSAGTRGARGTWSALLVFAGLLAARLRRRVAA